MKSVVAILCAACFLTMSLGTFSRAVAADTWETWPKKTAEPGVDQKPATDADGAAKKGEDAGKNVEKKSSSGNLGWWAAGGALVIGGVIAIAAGGSGSTSNH
jgi:hypothetical protein